MVTIPKSPYTQPEMFQADVMELDNKWYSLGKMGMVRPLTWNSAVILPAAAWAGTSSLASARPSNWPAAWAPRRPMKSVTTRPSVAGMKKSMDQLRTAADLHGHKEELKVLLGLQPIIRSTEAEARQRAEELAERIPHRLRRREFPRQPDGRLKVTPP